MYIVTATVRGIKPHRRHIVSRVKTLEEARKLFDSVHKRYLVEIYDGGWKFVERRYL